MFFLHEDENVTKRLCLNELFNNSDLFDLTVFFSLRNTLIEQTDILQCLSDEADEISRSRRCLDLQGIKQDSHCQISMYNAILALYYNVYITIKDV